MNLYKIIVKHHAWGDSEKGIACLLLAENDEAVFNWLASEPVVDGRGLYTSWQEKVDDWEGWMEEEPWDPEEHGGYPDFKSKIIAIKGEINDDDYDFSDASSGITLFGWELIQEYFNFSLPQILFEKQIIIIA